MRRFFFALFLLLPLLTSPASAQTDYAYCEDLWFARNLIFHRAGHCFSSPLGRAQFDNSQCTTRNATLPSALATQVAQIRVIERQFSCNVDTRRTTLSNQADLNAYRYMIDVPIRDFGATGCTGYRGSVLMLRNGARANAAVIGQIAPGASITFAHWPLNGWDYVSVHSQGYGSKNPMIWGWAFIGPGMPICDSYAG